MSDDAEVWDLRAKRAERAKARVARREGRGDLLELRFGDESVLLDSEFPLDVLSPLRELNTDVSLLLRQAIEIATAQSSRGQLDDMAFLLGLLSQNPDLPMDLINAVQEIGRRLLGEEGYAAFLAERPTPWDIAALIKCLSDWYGVRLGESRRPGTPPTDGKTAKLISDAGTTGLTLEESGSDQESQASSDFVTSHH